MPYKSINDLPSPVKDHLPKHAQEIFLEAVRQALQTPQRCLAIGDHLPRGMSSGGREGYGPSCRLAFFCASKAASTRLRTCSFCRMLVI